VDGGGVPAAYGRFEVDAGGVRDSLDFRRVRLFGVRVGPAFTFVLVLGCAGPQPGIRAEQDRKLTRGDLGVVFNTEDEAALAACAYLWKTEPRTVKWEFCGVIYRDSEGIKAGLPETNRLATYCRRPLEPPGSEEMAGYHNHRQSSDFSPEDRTYGATEPGYAIPLARYLCVPNGLVLRMTPEGTVIVK